MGNRTRSGRLNSRLTDGRVAVSADGGNRSCGRFTSCVVVTVNNTAGSSNCTSGASVGAVSVAGLLIVKWLIVITDAEAKLSRINLAVTPEEKSTEDWLGEDV